MGNKTQIMQHVKNAINFPCCLNTENEFLVVFSNVYTNKGLSKVNAAHHVTCNINEVRFLPPCLFLSYILLRYLSRVIQIQQ
jgi:hypothetical protein